MKRNECYRMFRRNGGVTVNDFDDFLRCYFGCRVKDKPVPNRGSLRLVVSDRTGAGIEGRLRLKL